MTHTDAMAVGDTQKALGGCMMPGFGGFPVSGDIFGIQDTVSRILATMASPFSEAVRQFRSPLDMGLEMFRQAHLIQAETGLAIQQTLGIEIVPNKDLAKFISDLESGKL